MERFQANVGLALIRCPSCQGLRSASIRRVSTMIALCKECARGEVVPRWKFCSFWVERFSLEEIEEMAVALFGEG